MVTKPVQCCWTRPATLCRPRLRKRFDPAIIERSRGQCAAITYHFGGKREFYRAVLTQYSCRYGTLNRQRFCRDGKQIQDADNDHGQLKIILTELAKSIISIFLEDVLMRWRAPLVMREYSLPSEDFSIIYKGRIEPIHKMMTALVAAILNKSAEDPECAICAQAIMGQIFVFGIARTVLW